MIGASAYTLRVLPPGPYHSWSGEGLHNRQLLRVVKLHLPSCFQNQVHVSTRPGYLSTGGGDRGQAKQRAAETSEHPEEACCSGKSLGTVGIHFPTQEGSTHHRTYVLPTEIHTTVPNPAADLKQAAMLGNVWMTYLSVTKKGRCSAYLVSTPSSDSWGITINFPLTNSKT